MSGELLLSYICYFHVLSHLLLIYICKLHWNQVRLRQSITSLKYFCDSQAKLRICIDIAEKSFSISAKLLCIRRWFKQTQAAVGQRAWTIGRLKLWVFALARSYFNIFRKVTNSSIRFRRICNRFKIGNILSHIGFIFILFPSELICWYT